MEDLFIRFFKQGLFALDSRGPYKCCALFKPLQLFAFESIKNNELTSVAPPRLSVPKSQSTNSDDMKQHSSMLAPLKSMLFNLQSMNLARKKRAQ